jgi:hypothetical protein
LKYDETFLRYQYKRADIRYIKNMNYDNLP